MQRLVLDEDDPQGACADGPRSRSIARATSTCFGARCPHAVSTASTTGCATSPAASGNEHAREQDLVDGRCTGSGNPDDSASTPGASGASGATCTRRASRPSGRRTWSRTRCCRSRASVGGGRGGLAKRACVDEEAAEPAQPAAAIVPARTGRATRSPSWPWRPRRHRQALHHPLSRVVVAEARAARPAAAEPRLCAAGPGTSRRATRAGRRSTRRHHRRARPRQRVCARQRALAAQQLQEAAVTAKQRKASKACLSARCATCSAAHRVAAGAACLIKHFQTAKHGPTPRPFAAASCTAQARLVPGRRHGAVPALDELAKHLRQRSASSTAAAKQPESSSHWGICSIQRSLASTSR